MIQERMIRRCLTAILLLAGLLLGLSMSVYAEDRKPSKEDASLYGEMNENSQDADDQEGMQQVREALPDREVCFYDADRELEELSCQVSEEGEIVLPALPEKKGFDSVGWRSSEGSTESVCSPGEVICWDELNPDEPTLYYAVYSRNSFIITFVEEGAQPTEAQVSKDTPYQMPTPAERNGMRGVGWSEEANAKTAVYNAGESYTISTDLTLYPVYRELYTLTFLTNTGKTTQRLQALTVTGIKGEKVILPKLPVYAGYTSLGWSVKRGDMKVSYKEGASYTIGGDRTFYQVNKQRLTVTYLSNSGSAAGFTGLKQTVLKNEYAVLPKLPAKSGYDSLGWSTTKGAGTAKYKAGAKVKITKDTKLYAVYKKITYYTVKFYNGRGSYAYKSLQVKVRKGTTLKLPELPRRLNWKGVGWSEKKLPKKNDSKAPGSSVRVNANLRFYGCWQSAKTVQFFSQNGRKEYLDIRRDVTGTSVVLPSILSPRGYTFLGWSEKPNQSSYPKYQMGQKITLKKGIKLYAVCMKQPLAALEPADLNVSQKYDMVYFIGDSRTCQMESRLKAQLGSVPDNTTFLCKNAQGIKWFMENKGDFVKKIKAYPGKKAVVFNLGVNDLRYHKNDYAITLTNYIRELEDFRNALKGSGCTLYFMSVNPVNDKEILDPSYGRVSFVRYPQWLRNFNSAIKSRVSGYQYIDMYNYLFNTGFEHVDGLHYSGATCDKIYNKVIAVIDRA